MKNNPGVLFHVMDTRGRHILSVSSLPSSPSALTFHGTHFTHVTTVFECNKKGKRHCFFFFFFLPSSRSSQENITQNSPKGATDSLTCSFRFVRPWFHYYHNSFSSVKEDFRTLTHWTQTPRKTTRLIFLWAKAEFYRLEKKLSTNSDEADVISLRADALPPIAALSPRPHESQAVWTWRRGTNHKVLVPHVGLSSSQINHRMYVGAETSQSQRRLAWRDTEDVLRVFLHWSHIFSISNAAFGLRLSDRGCTGYKCVCGQVRWVNIAKVRLLQEMAGEEMFFF